MAEQSLPAYTHYTSEGKLNSNHNVYHQTQRAIPSSRPPINTKKSEETFSNRKKDLLPHIPTLSNNLDSNPITSFSSNFLYPSRSNESLSNKLAEKPVLPPPSPLPASLSSNTKIKNIPSESFQTHTNKDHSTPTFNTTLGPTWCRIVDELYETRAQAHLLNSEDLNTHVEKRKIIQENFLKHIEELHHNAKQEDTWSYIFNVAEFLLISTGIIGGITLCATGANSGDWNLAKYGGEMILGSLLSMGSFALKQCNYDKKYVAALGLGGAFLTGLGMNKGLEEFAKNKLTKHFADITNGCGQFSKMFSDYIAMNSRKVINSIQTKQVLLQNQKEQNQFDIQKIIGNYKNEDLIELSRVVSEQLDKYAQVLIKILANQQP